MALNQTTMQFDATVQEAGGLVPQKVSSKKTIVGFTDLDLDQINATAQAQDILIIDSAGDMRRDASGPRSIFETPMEISGDAAEALGGAVSGAVEMMRGGEGWWEKKKAAEKLRNGAARII